MKIDELDPLLMLHPALNEVVLLSMAYHEGLTGKSRVIRARLSTTCLYHNILAEIFEETSQVKMVRGKPGYPKRGYLSNVEVEYLPDRSAWSVLITNGGNKRRNAKLPYKVKETLYVRRINGIYVVDNDFEERGA